MNQVKIGYTQGTFDMFHIGHLNLLKAAKQKCDFLIVGVNSDGLVQEYKKKKPLIPLEERMEIINSLKFVDKVIPTFSLDKLLIRKQYYFNYIFIGDDWKGTDRWNKTELELLKQDVKTVYLPYTKEISSTILRKKVIENEK